MSSDGIPQWINIYWALIYLKLIGIGESFLQNLIPYIYIFKGFANIADNRHILAMYPFFLVLNAVNPQFFIKGIIDSSNQSIIAKVSLQPIQPNNRNRFPSLYYSIFHLHFLYFLTPLLVSTYSLHFFLDSFALFSLPTFSSTFFFPFDPIFLLLSHSSFLSIFSSLTSLNFLSLLFLYPFIITFCLYTLTPLYLFIF